MKWSLSKATQTGLLVLGLMLVVFVTGCETTGGAAASAPLPSPASDPNTLGPDLLRAGDRIRIVISDIPDATLPTEQQVPEDGKLTLPKGVEINLLGKKRTDIEKEIQDIYVNQRRIYRRMSVIIERLSLSISVGGEVRSAGPIAYLGDMTVTKAINAAGGFTEYADRTSVIVTRANRQQVFINVKKALSDPKLDLPMYPGDSIYVKRSIL
jgi:protein involved in polysaccharide export with SLBB domain